MCEPFRATKRHYANRMVLLISERRTEMKIYICYFFQNLRIDHSRI